MSRHGSVTCHTFQVTATSCPRQLLQPVCWLQVPDILAHLNGMGEEELQEELTKVKAVIKEVEAKAQNLDLVQGLLRATKPSITRTIDEACARMMKLSQLQFKLIRYQSWKANLTPMPCFDHQVAGAVQFLEQDLLSVMEATVRTR